MQIFYLSNKINVYTVYHQCTIVNISLSTGSQVMPETCFMVISEYWCREDRGWLSLFIFVISLFRFYFILYNNTSQSFLFADYNLSAVAQGVQLRTLD